MSRDVNFSAEFSGKTEFVHRSRGINFPVKFSGKCTDGWTEMKGVYKSLYCEI